MSSSVKIQIRLIIILVLSPPVTPQDFCPEFEPFVEAVLPKSDFFSQHLPMFGLCVQKLHSGSRRQAAAHSSWVSAPSGNKLWPEYFVPSSMSQASKGKESQMRQLVTVMEWNLPGRQERQMGSSKAFPSTPGRSPSRLPEIMPSPADTKVTASLGALIVHTSIVTKLPT